MLICYNYSEVALFGICKALKLILFIFSHSVTKLQVVSNYAKDRPVIFSSFQPDAAKLVRELQSTYPVCSIFAIFFDK